MTVQRHWDTLDRITMESYARPTMATIVYIDGFNLYYGALRGSPSKWLDIEALSRRLLPKDDIHLVRYFTARITARPDDPQQAQRQENQVVEINGVACAQGGLVAGADVIGHGADAFVGKRGGPSHRVSL